MRGAYPRTVEANVDFTPKMLAESFADMGDEDQAQFFIEVAKIAERWTDGNFNQWAAVGGHLKRCSCSTPEARDMVRDMAYAIGEESDATCSI